MLFHRTRPAWGRAQTALLVCILVIFVCITWDVIYSGGTDLLEFHYSFVRTLPGGILAQGDAMANHLAAWEYLPGWPATINVRSIGVCVFDIHNTFFAVLASFQRWHCRLESMDSISSRQAVEISSDFPYDCQYRYAFVLPHPQWCKSKIYVGINIADCIWDDIEVTLEESSSTILDWLSSVMSLAVNIFATLLIAWKAWYVVPPSSLGCFSWFYHGISGLITEFWQKPQSTNGPASRISCCFWSNPGPYTVQSNRSMLSLF